MLALDLVEDATISPAKIIGSTLKLDPPASDLAYFDASQASAVLQPDNVTITNTGGTATLTLTDEATSAELGSQTFPFVITNGVAHFSQPSEVNDWMHAYSTYQGNVGIGFTFYTGIDDPPAGQTGTLTITAEYASAPYGSISIPDLGPTKPPVCKPPATNCKVQ